MTHSALAIDGVPPPAGGTPGAPGTADLAAFRTLRRDLESRSWRDRVRAVQQLSAFGPGAVPLLCEALQDRDDRVWAAAAAALGEMGDPRAVGPLAAIPTRLLDEGAPRQFWSGVRLLLLAVIVCVGLGLLSAAAPGSPAPTIGCFLAGFLAYFGALRLHWVTLELGQPAAEALAKIAVRSPTPALRQALSPLWRLEVHLLGGARLRFRKTVRTIEDLFAPSGRLAPEVSENAGTGDPRSAAMEDEALSRLPEVRRLLLSLPGGAMVAPAAPASPSVELSTMHRVCAALDSRRSEVRILAARALATVGDGRAIVPLRTALQRCFLFGSPDADRAVRWLPAVAGPLWVVWGALNVSHSAYGVMNPHAGVPAPDATGNILALTLTASGLWVYAMSLRVLESHEHGRALLGILERVSPAERAVACEHLKSLQRQLASAGSLAQRRDSSRRLEVLTRGLRDLPLPGRAGGPRVDELPGPGPAGTPPGEELPILERAWPPAQRR